MSKKIRKWLDKGNEAAEAGDWDEVIRCYQKAGEMGDADACLYVGQVYKEGEHVEQDSAKAREWLQKAAALGNKEAEKPLAALEKNEKALQEEAAAADAASCRDAQARSAFDKGVSCLNVTDGEADNKSVDYQQAEHWLLKAAEGGIDGAFYPLGMIYHSGLLGECDYERAVDCYEEAAASEDEYSSNAIWALVELYNDGESGVADEEKAAYWFQVLTDRQDLNAQVRVEGREDEVINPLEMVKKYLHQGLTGGDQENFVKADYWLKKTIGADGIDSAARKMLAMMQDALDDDDYEEGIKLMEACGDRGFTFYKVMADLHHKEGKDLKNKLYEEGMFHLQQSNKAGNAGDTTTAEAEAAKSLNAFLPSINAIKARKQFLETKAKYQKKNEASKMDKLNLTAREQEIFNQLLEGKAAKEIGYNLQISYPTVNFHMNNLYRKLGIQSRAELFAKYWT